MIEFFGSPGRLISPKANACPSSTHDLAAPAMDVISQGECMSIPRLTLFAFIKQEQEANENASLLS